MARFLIATATAAVCFGAVASTAGAANDPRMATLQRKVAALTSTVGSLQRSVNSLSGQVNTLTGQLQSAQAQVQTLGGTVQSMSGQVQALNSAVGTANGRIGNLEKAEDVDNKFDLCEFALNTDNFHFTWESINVVVKALAGVSNFITYGAPVDDKGTCAALGVPRSPKYAVGNNSWSLHAPESAALAEVFHHHFGK